MTSRITDHSRRASRLAMAWMQILALLPLALTLPRTVLSATQEANAELPASTEASVYAKAHRAVVRVTRGLYLGSGFFVDTLGGVILTEHGVGWYPDGSYSVTVDSFHRYPAQLLALDSVSGYAVLRVAPSVCRDCPRLKLAADQPWQSLAAPGDTVFAMGYPLRPGDSLAVRVVSGVSGRIITPDLGLDEGQSGGPLLNARGEVVGLNTYVWFESGAGGFRSVSLIQAGPTLAQAQESLSLLPLPDSTPLPVLPPGAFNEIGIAQMANEAQFEEYEDLSWNAAGPFLVSFVSPVIRAVRQRMYQAVLAKDGGKSKLTPRLQYARRTMMHGRHWLESMAGDTLAPAVLVSVIPRAFFTERGWLFGTGKYDLKYQGELAGVTFWRDSTIVEPILGGIMEFEQVPDSTRPEVKVRSHAGYYLFDPRVFQPDRDGRVPRLQFVLQDAKHPRYRDCLILQRRQVARIWNDFVPYFLDYPDEVPFVWANPELPQRLMLDLPTTVTGCPEATMTALPGTGR